MISDEYFQNLASKLTDGTERFILSLLEKVKARALELIEEPTTPINIEQDQQAIARQWEAYNQELQEWVDENMPQAYRQGLVQAGRNIPDAASLTAGAFASFPMFGGGMEGGRISDTAKRLLSDVPEHHQMYGVFQQAAYEDFANTRIPVIRSTTDKIRNLVVEASDEAYRTADRLTRRELTQDIMRRVSDEGITGIRYADGRTMKLDSYAEMVARSQTGNASRQAHINRLQEYGRDLILISSHYPVSPLCEPYQGRVYSLSGNSDNYPPLDEAIAGGLYHASCKHSQSSYNPGQSIPEPEDKLSKAENAERYEAQQQQRYNERQIRSWKRREVTAVTEDAQKKAKAKVSQWQARQREHLSENDYLRRSYGREQI